MQLKLNWLNEARAVSFGGCVCTFFFGGGGGGAAGGWEREEEGQGEVRGEAEGVECLAAF